MANKIFLDANVVLDFILKREEFESVKILFELSERNQIKLYISSSILHIIAYWLTKHLGSTVTKTTLLNLLEHIKVIEGNHDCSIKALESEFTDIEDALQYYVALQNKMDFIITFDKDLQKYSTEKLYILSVRSFINIHQSQ